MPCHASTAWSSSAFRCIPPASRASNAPHLSCDTDVPLLFLQGTRDDLADLALLRPIIQALGPRATLHAIADADHAFHVRVSSGSDDGAVMIDLADATVRRMTSCAGRSGGRTSR